MMNLGIAMFAWRMASRVGVLLMAGLLFGCAGGGAALPDIPPQNAEYQLGHGDRMLIQVFGQPELSGEHQVDGEGNISMPLIGTVKAGGGSADELETRIVDRLKPDYLNDPRVSVQVVGYRPFYVLGEVNKPGSYAYVDGMTVTNAVALAGGYTYRARQDEFYIVRSYDPEKQRRVAGPNTQLRPGDVLTVRERYF